MSRKKPVEEKPLTAAILPPKELRDYFQPVVTVAQIAAQLLKEKGGDYHLAAKAAIALLNACEVELTVTIDDPYEQAVAEFDSFYNKLYQTVPAHPTFAECARYVTRLSQDDRAQPRFRLFLKDWLRYDKAIKATGESRGFGDYKDVVIAEYNRTPETSIEELNEMLDTFEIRQSHVLDWSMHYKNWDRQEKSKVASRNAKKGGGRPRSTTN